MSALHRVELLAARSIMASVSSILPGCQLAGRGNVGVAVPLGVPSWRACRTLARDSVASRGNSIPPRSNIVPRRAGKASVDKLYGDLVAVVTAKQRKPHAYQFHRVLDRVNSQADLDVAMDTLLLCHSARVKFDLNGATSTKLVKACCRVHNARAAVNVLRQASKYRLKPRGGAIAELVAHGTRMHDAQLVGDAVQLFLRRSLAFTPKTLHILVKGVLDTGEGSAAAKIALQLTQRADSAGCKIGLGVWNKVIGAVSSLPLHTMYRVHEPGEACESTVDQQLRHMVLEFVRLLELRLQPSSAGQAQVLDRGLQLARQVADADARAAHATRLRRSRRKNMNRRLRARSQRQ